MGPIGSVLWAVVLGMAATLTVVPASHAAAASGCLFASVGTTMTLRDDCVTDATILIPDGFTLDGSTKTITAVDPWRGHFRGAVVASGGATAHVRHLVVDTLGLADVCNAGADRLRGILFDGASGSIVSNHVRNINQGASGCDEGIGIEIREGAIGADVVVRVAENAVINYQKAGILASGRVDLTIRDNHVTGAGPAGYIAQNGIQLGLGATGTVERNAVSANDATASSLVSCGLMVFEPDGVRAEGNRLVRNERNLCLGGGDGEPKPAD